MAAVSTIANGRAIGSPHKQQQRDQDQWDFSIPAGLEDQRFGGQVVEQYANAFAPRPTNPIKLDEIEPSKNIGAPKSPRSAGQKVDSAFLSPYKQGSRPDLGGSRSNSEPDSLLDLYGHPSSITEKSMESPQHRGSEADVGAPVQNDDPEQSRWIHRDKLAEIESREMRAAGIIPPPVRSKSRSRHDLSQDQTIDVAPVLDDEPLPPKESKRRRVKSPPEPEDESPDVAISGNDFDIRTPEEIAADSYMERTTSPVYRQQQGLRSSSSRIPLPKSSPMPVPQEHLERTTPLPRKRGASGNWDGEDSIAYNRTRSRGNSFGSQVLLDDIDTSPPNSSGSPTKIRTPSSTSKHLRKNSNTTPISSTKPRTATSNTPRPKSRSGLEPRPPTAINRPEGDAPWLKDMYKPDPMLPPDQQLLPTHAKRLQEEQRRKEQWEQAQRDSEARKQRRLNGEDDGDDDDRPQPLQKEFSPLAEYTANGLQPSPGSRIKGTDYPQQSQPSQSEDTNSEWPLTRATDNPPAFDTPNSGGSNGNGIGVGDRVGNAGYSAMPRVRSGHHDGYVANVTAGFGGGEAGSATTSPKGQQGLDPFEKERLGRGEEGGERKNGKKEKEKRDEEAGCCSCVVM